ncbi:hypothetical protein RND81_11G117100 [Saponaria officinalis]|uniref:Uncharacterized protein n=1 Tax=Saponaria officinalis TaxID=3572 RepID=A0AAW1HLB3_SAPOF
MDSFCFFWVGSSFSHDANFATAGSIIRLQNTTLHQSGFNPFSLVLNCKNNDADTIVIQNIDDFFKCGKFCSNLKHSEWLNSGILVVEPSEALFNDMVKKIKTLSSYIGGDQRFLNSYYVGFANAHLFGPNFSPEEFKSGAPLYSLSR